MMERYRDGITRRNFIRMGTLGVVGLPMADLFSPRTALGAGTAPARAVILLWMDGGPPPHETFDPKPGAPLEIRGEFGAIPTNVAGIQVSKLMPRMARQMDKVALLRTLSHNEGTHEGACRALLADLRSLPAFAHPRLGPTPTCPEVVCVDPYGAIGSPVDRKPFEPDTMRDAYGDTTIGRSCLLARRMVEAGARFVTVTQGGWDTHSGHFAACKTLVPALDQAFAALLEDLHQRGLLATTLVLWMGEFGRTPTVNAMAGRDHWPHTACAVFAGAGVRGGQVIGETDAAGAYPTSRAVSPEDAAQTVAHTLGLSRLTARGAGEVIRELV